MLQEALIYLDMGWGVYPAHSVTVDTGFCSCGRLDCPCPGKHPIGQWSEFQRRLPTKHEIKLWFSVLDCNIGMVTGLVSGITVVDIDGVKGVNSAKTLGLEPTLTARTGGGGYHLFYSITEHTKSRVQVFEGIDIRGDGGYVVLSPSLHKSGKHYEWLEPRGLAPFDPEPFEKIVSRSFSDDGWFNELLQGVPVGNRNMSAARLSGRYFSIGLSIDEVWILMQGWNQRNDPPLDLVELKRTVEAIRKKHEETSVPIQVETLKQIRSLLGRGEHHVQED